MYAYMLFAAIFLSTESNSRELYWIEEKKTRLKSFRVSLDSVSKWKSINMKIK